VRQIPLSVRLADRAVFGSFLPAHNAEALAHLQRLASGAAGGLTWLCGPRGSGKTHLLQAVCAAASEHMRAGYVPLAEVAALGVGLLDGLPQMQCLCLDDVDRVAGQHEWERGIFGLLREIEESGARLVLAAQAPPALIDFSLADLTSRSTSCSIRSMRRRSPRSGASPCHSFARCCAQRGCARTERAAAGRGSQSVSRTSAPRELRRADRAPAPAISPLR